MGIKLDPEIIIESILNDLDRSAAKGNVLKAEAIAEAFNEC